MTSRQRTDLTIRRKDVGKLYLSGMTQPAIARELGVSQPTVSRDMKVLRDEWLASALIDVNAAKAKELAKIDNLEIEYWEAWRRSIGEHIQEVTKAKGPAKGSPTDIEKVVRKNTLVGDPRFLQGIQWCIDKRCKILGLDSPQLVELSWEDEVVDLLTSGDIEPEQVENDFGTELALSLFKRAGINVSR